MAQYILGVDAAWTLRQPSGVALLEYKTGAKPKLIKIARSYLEFYRSRIPWQQKPLPSAPELDQLTDYCRRIGYPVQVVALDMPLSPKPQLTYRAADRAISRQYSRMGAAVHSPTPERPGQVADIIFEQLIQAGYQWTAQQVISDQPSFIEVYPHVSIIELFSYTYRFPYKVHKKGKYWKDSTPAEQYTRLIGNLNRLREHLHELIEEDLLFTLNPEIRYTLKFLKGYEDVLDSMIAAITGVYYLEGRIRAFGDADSAIWVPERKSAFS